MGLRFDGRVYFWKFRPEDPTEPKSCQDYLDDYWRLVIPVGNPKSELLVITTPLKAQCVELLKI